MEKVSFNRLIFACTRGAGPTATKIMKRLAAKLCERRNLYSHSTPYDGPICAISSNSYDWDSSESGGKRSKPSPLPHMQLWLYFSVTVECPYNDPAPYLKMCV